MISYTHSFEDLDSSLVDNVWYDEPTVSAYVDLNDEVYRYDKVALNDVKELVNAPSIGRAFNGYFLSPGFKRKFGPGKHLGYVLDLEFTKREDVTAPTQTTLTHDGRVFTTTGLVGKNLTYSDSATVDGKPVTFSNGDTATFTTGPVSTDADKIQPVRVSLAPRYAESTKGGTAKVEVEDEPVRIPLKAPANDPVEVTNDYEFTVHFDSNGPKTYTTRARDWHDAVQNLNDAADILGVDLIVTGVFVHLV